MRNWIAIKLLHLVSSVEAGYCADDIRKLGDEK